MVRLGVQTNITQSIDLSKMDQIGTAAMTPIHSLYAGKDHTHMATPEAQANILIFLASSMSAEISGAIIPVDHAWSTI